MRYVFALLFTLLTFTGFAYGSTHGHILPFKIWKQKKIDEAKSLVGELKHQTHKLQVKSDGEDEEIKQDLNQKLSQAELNLGVAKELSANDYFLLYIAPQFKEQDALLQAAKTLTPRDMADILTAYQKRLQTQEAYNTDSGTASSLGDSAPSLEKTAKAP